MGTSKHRKRIAQLLEQRAQIEARKNFFKFVQYTFGEGYQTNWHHRLIAQELERWLNTENGRLVINCPSRHGKSELCSRRLPAYILGQDPDARIIACSYGQDLANDMSVDVKKIIRSAEYQNVFPDTKLPTKDSTRAKGDRHYRNKKEIWEIMNSQGRYLARGVGGGIAGKGGDYLLLDDPIKDYEQARSPRQRDRVWSWFNKVFRERASRKARILVIQTRWHRDDPVGRIKREMREIEAARDWRIVNLPAIYRETVRDRHPDDPREPGEALWPWFKSKQEWKAIEQSDPETFMSLGQGMPSPPGGEIIKESWIIDHMWTELPPPKRNWIWAIDPKGGSDEPQSSKAVIQLWCRSRQEEANAYLVDQESGLWSQGETEDKIRELYDRSPWDQARTLLIENKGDGPGIKDHLKDEIPGICTVDPWAGKKQRLRDVESFWRSGNVRVPDNRDPTQGPTGQNFKWIDQFINQHISFPGGDRDDAVDAAVYAIDHLLGSRGGSQAGEQEHYLAQYYGG